MAPAARPVLDQALTARAKELNAEPEADKAALHPSSFISSACGNY
jgi:hypothetical protein